MEFIEYFKPELIFWGSNEDPTSHYSSVLQNVDRANAYVFSLSSY